MLRSLLGASEIWPAGCVYEALWHVWMLQNLSFHYLKSKLRTLLAAERNFQTRIECNWCSVACLSLQTAWDNDSEVWTPLLPYYSDWSSNLKCHIRVNMNYLIADHSTGWNGERAGNSAHWELLQGRKCREKNRAGRGRETEKRGCTRKRNKEQEQQWSEGDRFSYSLLHQQGLEQTINNS